VSFLFLVVLQAATAQTATGTSNVRDLSARWAEYYAEVYRVPVDLVDAIIDEESGWPMETSRHASARFREPAHGQLI